MTSIQHILVATDFGAASTRALEVAAEIAIRFDAKVTVVHTIEDLSYVFPCSVPPEIRQSAAFQLDHTVKRIRLQVPGVEGMLREGFAWHEITEAAKEISADLVVLGSHGHGAAGPLIGSVAEKVARVCAVPVLTVHAWRFEDRTHAGRELAELLLQSDEEAPSVVALSLGSAMVGAEVAQAFGAPLHMLLTRALERDGCVLGAVCEDGTVHLDETGKRAAGDREHADAGQAHAELLEEARHLRSPRWADDGKAGTILLVSDAILAAAPTIVAAQALRRVRPHRFVAAAPVATVSAREALSQVVDRVVVVQTVEAGVPLSRVYRDLSAPSDRAVVERLGAAAQWAHAVERRS